MGYCATCNGIEYTIVASKIQDATKALRTAFPDEEGDLKGMIDNICSFRGFTNSNGSFVIETWAGEKIRQQRDVLNALAPYFEEGDTSEWVGEDGFSWEWVVEDGKIVEHDEASRRAQAIERATKPLGTVIEELHKVIGELMQAHPEQAARYVQHPDAGVRDAAAKVLGGKG